jgi:predicted nucleic acid-binding Zn ribbon protein
MADARPLGEILADYIRASGWRERSRLKGVQAGWAAAAGERYARHCRVAGVKQGVLFVDVDSAACLHEMAGFRKAEIIAALAGHKGCEHIHDIKFKLGGEAAGGE